ncbi:MAG: hypothetical protein J0L86_00350 [Flavobacteriales bacterium]|nr:hypothetical protein [Flavobacteriales bacterium]
MNKAELIQQIRFGIQQLKPNNGTLYFEHICRFFARARIAKNIIPATGPVQSHGDQGRDFETFHSYLSKSDIKESCSIGFSNKPIAFACSLEKNPLKPNGKINKDVDTILKSGCEIDRIYFFSGEDIPVGSRHKKHQEIKEKNKIDLEIIDAQTLSEHLSDPDLFWIASQYLNIPNDFFPRKVEENWYNIIYKEYQERELKITFEEFTDIKSAIRYIYKDEDLKVDLPFWFNKLEIFFGNNCPRELKRKAIYEKFVAKLIGQNDISNLEDLIKDYFSDMDNHINPACLDDAQILLTFVNNSKLVIGSHITFDEIEKFKKNLSEIIHSELQKNISSSQRCSYIEIQANLLLNNNFSNIKEFNSNINSYVLRLEQIFPKLKNSPFFPLERLSNRVLDILGMTLEFGGDAILIENFIEKLDVFLGERNSDFRIGDSIRDRATQYLKTGKTSTAISLLHQLKVKWFANEATRGVILTSMLLADCYSKLEMEYASKYYSLVAADMALAYKDNNVIDLFPRAINSAAESAYISGSWLHYLDLLDTVLSSSHIIKKDFNLYSDTNSKSLVYYPALIKLFSNMFNLEINSLIENKISKWGYIKNEIDDVYNSLKKNKELFSIDKTKESLNKQLVGIPFNDIGETREIAFNIYASNWNVKFKNDYCTNSVAEQFVSILQIILVEFSNTELFLIKANILINLKTTESQSPKYNQLPSNDLVIWNIEIPNYNGDDLEKTNINQVNYVALITSILRTISLLPDEKMKIIINDKLSKGLLNATTFGQTYKKLYNSYINDNDFNYWKRNQFNNYSIIENFKLKSNQILTWNSKLSETYSFDKNIKIIQKRLNHLVPFAKTLEMVKKNPKFKEIINELRKDWLDWQIYLAFGNMIINYKLSKMGIVPKNEDANLEYRNSYLKYANKPEHEWYIDIPIEVFNFLNFDKYLSNINIANVLPSYGLEFHSETPDTNAIKELLIHRFNFMEDGKELLIF